VVAVVTLLDAMSPPL